MKIKKYLVIMAAAGLLLAPSCIGANHPPIITSLKAEPEAIRPSANCQIECIATDEDGDELSYEWFASKGDIDGNGASATWTAPDSEDSYNILVTVTDGNGGKVRDYVAITVRLNNPPTIKSLIADTDWVIPASSCHIECNAEDPDGDDLDYEWSTSGGNISGTGSVVIWTAPARAGLYDIQVVVADGGGEKDTDSLTLSVALGTPPVIENLIVTAKEPKYIKKIAGGYKVGKTKEYVIECVVSDTSEKLVYQWSCEGGEISGEGSSISWTAPDVSDTFTLTAIVSDAHGNMASKKIVLQVVSCSSCTFG